MKTRVITAFFFACCMLGSLFLGPFVFAAFGLLLVVVGLLEFYRLVKSTELSPNIPAGIILSLAVYGLAFSVLVYNKSLQNALLLIPVVLLVFVAELYRKSSTPFQNIAITLLAVCYVAIPFSLYLALGFMGASFSFILPLSLLLLIWANDSGAYVFGITLGKNRLFERHSPKKSWEGFIGCCNALAEGCCNLFESSVLQKAGEQKVTRFKQCKILFIFNISRWQESGRFKIQQGSCHD